MSWVSRGENRWEWIADDTRHLLVRVGEQMRELHGTTVHVYLLGDAGLFPLEPLAGCTWVATYTPENWGALAALDTDAAFGYLERQEYVG